MVIITELFTHAQTVGTRSLFLSYVWPGNEANQRYDGLAGWVFHREASVNLLWCFLVTTY